MSKISKNKVNYKVGDLIKEQLISALAAIKDKNEMSNFLDSLLTNSERVMLTKRLAIAVLLENGVSYSDISKLLKVSSVTVGFVKNNVLKDNDSYTLLVQKINKLMPLLRMLKDGGLDRNF